jgi:hypothetical protein
MVSRVDPIAVLAVISSLTDTTGTHPALIKQLSADDMEQLNGILVKAGIDDPAGLIEALQKGFSALFDIPLTIPEIKSAKIAGTLTVVTQDATPITQEDLLSYDLTAEYSVRETGEKQILRYGFGNDVVIQDNSASFSFDDKRPIFRIQGHGSRTR